MIPIASFLVTGYVIAVILNIRELIRKENNGG